VTQEVAFHQELRDSLEGNRKQWDEQLTAAAADSDAAFRTQLEWVPRLEAKVSTHTGLWTEIAT